MVLVFVSPLALGQVNQEIDQVEDLLAVASIDNEVGTVRRTSLPAALSRKTVLGGREHQDTEVRTAKNKAARSENHRSGSEDHR